MPDRNEKEKRKQMLGDLKKRANEEFEKRLPMSRETFTKLFDYLDEKLNEEDCDHTTRFTEAFLKESNIENAEGVLIWLANNGGNCDCEVLSNVEEKFE